MFSLSWSKTFFKLGEIFFRYKLWMILLMTPLSKLSSFPNRTFCFTSFSVINKLSGRNDFPHGSFANTCCNSCFCYYSSCPKLWLISTFTLFLKILCDIQYYLLLLHAIRFSSLSFGTPWKWWNDVSHLPVDPKGKLARAWAKCYNGRHQLSIKFLCLCCQ